MTLDSEILRKLAHSGLKTLGSLIDLLELYDVDKNRGLHDPDTRKVFRRSIQSLAQAIRDLRLIAICEDSKTDARNPLNWKSLIEENLSGRYSKSVSFIAENADYQGDGYSELIGCAVTNLAWFAKRFWKNPVTVHLWLVKTEKQFWIRLEWDFGNSIIVNPEFATFPPFYPMFPTESLALDQSTGLALSAVKCVAELHGGSLSAKYDLNNLKLEFTCPISNIKK